MNMYLRSFWMWKVNSNDKHKINCVINEFGQNEFVLNIRIKLAKKFQINTYLLINRTSSYCISVIFNVF